MKILAHQLFDERIFTPDIEFFDEMLSQDLWVKARYLPDAIRDYYINVSRKHGNGHYSIYFIDSRFLVDYSPEARHQISYPSSKIDENDFVLEDWVIVDPIEVVTADEFRELIQRNNNLYEEWFRDDSGFPPPEADAYLSRQWRGNYEDLWE